MEEYINFEIAKKLKDKGFSCHVDWYYDKDEGLCWGIPQHVIRHPNYTYYPRASISAVMKWLREEKNIDIDIDAYCGMLGDKVYTPYISTYTEFTLETSPDVIRWRQRKFNPYNALPHELIPSHIYFNKWEDAALYTIEYVLDKLI